ncbi:hypothetical protein [Tenacibaculum sp. M341]|uniref:hypothetical protein n=1 Tax=Tenacibaculum sp. M341 TaxID=2530339 RepID=UPI00104CC5C9|nr:hypothetical protein [Tenacibaculum sp. M341]TCI95040.1 hypothetical protein EYW44_01575 [Tenacibaculum sp. M341]
MKDKLIPQLFIIFLRYLMGFAFVFNSIKKIKGNRFTTESGAENPIDSAWHFFETLYESGIYWKFLGLGQLIAGLLLITQRYAKLGAVMFFPIMANIFVITISYDFRYTYVVTALMLLANILLLLWDWNTLKVLINLKPTVSNIKRLEDHKVWSIIGLTYLSCYFIAALIANDNAAYILLLSFAAISIFGFVFGIRNRKAY